MGFSGLRFKGFRAWGFRGFSGFRLLGFRFFLFAGFYGLGKSSLHILNQPARKQVPLSCSGSEFRGKLMSRASGIQWFRV